MRIWSLHPQYLDTKGLVALWRETLLAKHVLEGKTKGYKNHPQLDRFKARPDPVNAINAYLAEVFHEAERRWYAFDREKIQWDFTEEILTVTEWQTSYETRHLLSKLSTRDPQRYSELKNQKNLTPHSLFHIIPGEVESWEVIS